VNTIVDRYFEAWNDVDDDHRAATLAAIFTEDAAIIDPDWTATGRVEIVDAIGQARRKLGDLALGRTALISEHHDRVLYSWHLGEPSAPVATGYGVLTIENGKIRQADNFFG
jgi:hypothetical protein